MQTHNTLAADIDRLDARIIRFIDLIGIGEIFNLD
jgi:hypothetical protein